MLRHRLAQIGSTTFDGVRQLSLWKSDSAPRIRSLLVSIDHFVADTAEGPTLWLLFHDGSLSEFVLNRGDGGQIEANLFMGDEAPRQIILKAPAGATHASFASLSLDVVPILNVLARAARTDPLETGKIVYYRAIGMRRRARNRLYRTLPLINGTNYARWITARDGQPQPESVAAGVDKPATTAGSASIATLVVWERGDQDLQATIRALDAGGFASASVTIVSGTADFPDNIVSCSRTALSLSEALTSSKAEFVWLLGAGDAPAKDALELWSDYLNGHPTAEVVYGDHDVTGPSGQLRTPLFKPDWNEALFWAQDYLGGALVRRETLSRALGGLQCKTPTIDDLVFAAIQEASGESIGHVPAVTHHCSSHNVEHASSPQQRHAHRIRVETALQPAGARVSSDRFGFTRVRWPLPTRPPRVSLIVPTRDRLDLLRPCVEGLRYRTDYPDIEIVIADNGSQEADTLNYYDRIDRDPSIKIVPCHGPFNFARINNQAAAAASGSVLGCINNDIEVSGPDWLSEMVSWALRPDIGAVGARLLYASGLVQHGGVLLGLNGMAGHAHRFLPPNHPGYMGRLQCHQKQSAVTAACLIVERQKFETVEGFDEENFAVAFNDVDLCLRLNEAGYQTLWTPYAELFHKESASRARDYSKERLVAFEKEIAALQSRWSHLLDADPHYNINLTRRHEDFRLREWD